MQSASPTVSRWRARSTSCCARSPMRKRASWCSSVVGAGPRSGRRSTLHGGEQSMRARDRRTRIRRLCADGELETVFQPMIELDSDQPVAYEALTRFPGQTRSTREYFADATELGVG